MTQTIYVNPGAGGVYSDGDGSSGNPFRSLYYALTQIATPFTSATEDYVVRLKTGVDLNGNGATGASIFIGTTSVTPRQLLITVDTAGDQHTGVRSTGYQFPTIISINNSNSAVAVNLVGISAQIIAIDGTSAAVVTATNCASFDSPGTHGSGLYAGGSTVKWINCIAAGSTGPGFLAENNSSAPTVTCINCDAAAATTYGFQQTGGSMALINCYSGGNTTEAYNGTITKTSCRHSTATSFTGSTASTAYTTANFTNVTASTQDLHLASGSALIAAGVGPTSNASVPTVDFAGTARGGTTTDVGFNQRTAFSAAGALLTQLERGSRGMMRGSMRGSY